MKRLNKIGIFITILFMAVGFAAVSTTLSINGVIGVFSTYDFKVYFSDGYLNDEKNYSVFADENTIEFNTTISSTSDVYTIKYDVTNGSKNYDANVKLECVGNNENVSVTNNLDNSLLDALDTKQGTLTIKPTNSYSGGDTEVQIICVISSTPSERTSIAEGDAAKPIESCKWSYFDSDYDGELSVGDTYSFCSENFNVLKIDGKTVSLFAQQNLGTNARQSYEANLARFSQYSGWDYSGKLEVPIMEYSGATKNLLTEYLDYIKFHSNDDSIKIDLVSMSELGDLGCTVPTNYSDGSGYNCNGSAHSYWIDNFQAWWTKSVSNGSYYRVWYYNGANAFGTQSYDRTSGVRPVILIPKSTLTGIPEAPEPEPEPEPEPDTPEEEEEVEPEPPAGWVREYTDGTLYRINGEEFYVFDETYTKLHLIARYNIGSNGRQSSSIYTVQMISNPDWAGQPGPLEVKVLNYEGAGVTLLKTYTEYIQTLTTYKIKGDLPTFGRLIDLGCIGNKDYTYTTSYCSLSSNRSWLMNNQTFWTKSAAVNSNDSRLWAVYGQGVVYDDGMGYRHGVRPVLVIPKEALPDLIY